MAVKWAVANGNWNAGATWNGGVVPTSDDIVYCNGYMITANISNIVVKELHNDVNPNTNIGGGYVRFNVEGLIFTAEKIIVGATFWCDMRQQSLALIINADIYAEQSGGYVFSSDVNSSPARELYVSLNGNVYTDNGAVMTRRNGNNNLNISINGNIYNYGGGAFGGSSGYFTVNGTWILTYNISARSRMIYVSRLIAENCHIDSVVSVNGTIEYQGNYIGANPNLLTILNPDTFTWKDITEPRTNPFIIVTNAEMNNRQQYPSEDEVKEGTEYVWGEKVGTYTPNYPPESVVLKDYEYGDSDDRKTGTMVQEVNVEVGCVTKEDVREGVELIGMGEVGTLVVPDVDDVREGVVFDNGSVGTLIVEGGGERLRIADFGYYTNAQSDTYIVDLTEQDKPKFAVAEERVLIEMFPDLDFDNIPDKYFDDLFVKYLKYRLIVEYYRTAGINSTFTPSEPTTEIVNYQNVRNEVWLNSANIYLKAWAKKYPESIVKPQRILL